MGCVAISRDGRTLASSAYFEKVRVFDLAARKELRSFPAHGNFKKLLFDHGTPKAILDTVLAPGFSMFDQWEAQMLAMILVRARAGLYSEIPADEIRRAHVEPIADVSARLAEELERVGRDAPIAVLPEGPMTIPYLMR